MPDRSGLFLVASIKTHQICPLHFNQGIIIFFTLPVVLPRMQLTFNKICPTLMSLMLVSLTNKGEDTALTSLIFVDAIHVQPMRCCLFFALKSGP